MASFGLVADYGSSDNDSDHDMPETAEEKIQEDDSSDDSTEEEDDDEEIEMKNSQKTKLPSAADLLGTSSGNVVQGGVLKNKYKIAEDQKIANLERHVKMVNTDLNTKTKNGKKICWSYRKGRCRFGSACTFAHDSDVQATDTKPSSSGETQREVQKKAPSGITDKVKKKRPGLSNTLVPGKKVVQMYKNLKNT